MGHSIGWYTLLGVDILLGIIAIILVVLLIVLCLCCQPEKDEFEESVQKTQPSMTLRPLSPQQTQRSQTLIIDLTQRSVPPTPPPIQIVPVQEPSSESSDEEIEPFKGDTEHTPKDQWIDFEPKTLDFASGVTAMKKIGMTNTTKKRLAVKVLCSNNAVYRVEPVYSFVEPMQSFGAEVHRLDDGKAPREERLLFQIIEASPTDTNIRELFKNAKNPKEVEFKICIDGRQLLVQK